jgi:hypothetical protein
VDTYYERRWDGIAVGALWFHCIGRFCRSRKRLERLLKASWRAYKNKAELLIWTLKSIKVQKRGMPVTPIIFHALRVKRFALSVSRSALSVPR